MKISMMWITAVGMTMMLTSIMKLTKKKVSGSKEKSSSFECGFNIMSPSHIPFSFQFFLVALLFLIFDVEIAMILSYPMETTTTKNLTMMFSFLMVLTIGLLYEWQKSKIEWSK